MANKDTIVADLVFNTLTQEQFDNADTAGSLNAYELYATPDNSLKTNQITNCITEIPQDIKLELNNGTLTLKAGSKVYVPNGAGKFDILVTEKDISSAYSTTGTSQNMLLLISDGSSFDTLSPKAVSSGSTDSAAGVPYHAWYDTTNNLVKLYLEDGVTVARYLSLPFAITHGHNNGGSDIGVDGIDQVFNGFGYIGSTVFALPGVKGLVPNGRNEDGTLKNTDFTVSNVLVSANQSYTIPNVLWAITSDEIQLWDVNYYKYDEKENKSYELYNGSQLTTAPAMFGSLTSGVISNFEQKTTFHAVDYNEVVHNTGDETIGGIKTFTSTISSNLSTSKPVIQNDNGTQFWLFDYNLDSTSKYKGGFLFRCLKTDGTWIDFVGNNGGSLTWNDKPIVTTEAKSLARNGYVKLNNGLIIQWGRIAAEAASTNGSVTFPTAFTSANASVQIGIMAAGNAKMVRASNITTTGFSYVTDTFGSANPTAEKTWLAIGY